MEDKERPTGVEDVGTFRCMTRTDGSSGYLFFSNYQRYVENKDLEVQVKIKLRNGEMLIPNKPTLIPKDCAGIWAINLNLANNVNLNYATTQLICKVPSSDGDTYFFFAPDGLDAEYSFDAKTVKHIYSNGSGVKTSESGDQYIAKVREPNKNSIMEIESADGRKFRICTLNKKEAMQTFRFKKLWGQTRLVMADGDVLTDSKSLYIQRIGKSYGDIRIFPTLQSMSMNNTEVEMETDGIWGKCTWTLPEKKVNIELTKTDEGYELFVPDSSMKNIYDVFLDFNWTGNVLEVYKNDRLFSDWIYYGPHFRPSLRHWGEDVLNTKLRIKSLPISPETKCYIEPEYRPDFSRQSSYSVINNIEALPQYRITLREKD